MADLRVVGGSDEDGTSEKTLHEGYENPDYYVVANVRIGGDHERRVVGRAQECGDGGIVLGFSQSVQFDEYSTLELIPNADAC